MSYAIIRNAKYKRNNLKGIFRHNERRNKNYSNEISDLAFVKWNRQMFKYDKNSSDLVLKRGFKYACDVPKRVSNVVNASSIKNICVKCTLILFRVYFFILVIFLNFK